MTISDIEKAIGTKLTLEILEKYEKKIKGVG